MARYYDWQQVFSRQTGTNGEFAIIAGAKDIGKTFGLRLELVRRFLKKGLRFVEFSRSKDERDNIQGGYFDKLQQDGFYTEYRYKTSNNIGYLCKPSYDNDGKEILEDWQACNYFVSLSTFQQEKKRTFANVQDMIFDEAIIDRKDKYHRYLPNEFSILANLIDTILRQDYENPKPAHCFILGNACDLLCPYLQHLGIARVPEYGFSWHNDKHTLLHYVEPWDVEQRKANTLVGRMLAGSSEAAMIFDNEFADGNDLFIDSKPSNARYHFGIRYQGSQFAIWVDWQKALIYVTGKIPKNSKDVFALTKSDATIDYVMIRKTDDMLKTVLSAFYAGLTRYDSPATREKFMHMLAFFGVY